MLCTIVGSGEGLGAAIARRFGRAGGRIALVARTKRPDLVGGLNATGIDARAFQADAASEPEVKQAFASIECWAGETDVLIYNAAAMRADLASELTPSRLLEDMAINLGAPENCPAAPPPVRPLPRVRRQSSTPAQGCPRRCDARSPAGRHTPRARTSAASSSRSALDDQRTEFSEDLTDRYAGAALVAGDHLAQGRRHLGRQGDGHALDRRH